MSELELDIPLHVQIACVEREIAIRKGAYPGFVRRKMLSQKTADHELEAMKAVLKTLKRVAAKRAVFEAAGEELGI